MDSFGGFFGYGDLVFGLIWECQCAVAVVGLDLSRYCMDGREIYI